jgi:hypothetical protein
VQTAPEGTQQRRLLIVYHTQFGATAQMARAAFDGARSIEDIDTVLKRARTQASPTSSAKCAHRRHFRELRRHGRHGQGLPRAHVLPARTQLEGRPYALIVCAGTDGTGAVRDVERVATGWRLRKALPELIYKSGMTAQQVVVPDEVLARCREIGATLAAGVAAGSTEDESPSSRAGSVSSARPAAAAGRPGPPPRLR